MGPQDEHETVRTGGEPATTREEPKPQHLLDLDTAWGKPEKAAAYR